MKPLAGGARAVLLLNRGTAPATIGTTWRALGYPDRLKATVTDLWSKQVAAGQSRSIKRVVPPHAVVMLRVAP